MPWTQVACLYHQLMRNANQFHSHMYRSYALRRIRYAFKQGKSLKDPKDIQAAIKEAERTLPMVQRQAILTQLYPEKES